MQSIYYTPNTEEFRIEVECQVYYPREDIWKDRKIRHWEDLNEILARFITYNKSIRFKYLDVQDILDFGFTRKFSTRSEILDTSCTVYISEKNNLMLNHYPNLNKITIVTMDYSKNSITLKSNWDNKQINLITVKNKAELQWILERLN